MPAQAGTRPRVASLESSACRLILLLRLYADVLTTVLYIAYRNSLRLQKSVLPGTFYPITASADAVLIRPWSPITIEPLLTSTHVAMLVTTFLRTALRFHEENSTRDLSEIRDAAGRHKMVVPRTSSCEMEPPLFTRIFRQESMTRSDEL